jgi:NAD(P)-dependent dehydrogenase (short-subunit alcohol dehydrogenase family)
MKGEIEQMAKQRSGAIVNASSLAGLVGRVGSAGYSASKHGVVGLTKTASIEYAALGIRVNAVCPGVIATRMTEERMDKQAAATLAAIPLGRMGHPQDVANLAAWLCSDRAAFVTGAIYNIDGGQLAG